MSNTSAIIAKIKISNASYQDYLRSGAIDPLAQCIFEDIQLNSGNFFIFQYHKKEKTLIAYLFYAYGDREVLEKGSEIIKNIEPYLDIDSEGYLGGCTDTLGYYPGDIAYFYTIKDRKWELSAKVEDGDIEKLIAVEKDYFVPHLQDGDMNMASLIESKAGILDKVIIEKVIDLQKDQNIGAIIRQATNATPGAPVRLFEQFHFDGKHICIPNTNPWNGLETIVFHDIDPYTFRQRPYGASDDKHVITRVFGYKVAKTDPDKFRMLTKGEWDYYVSEISVYDFDCNLIPDADPTTFKLTHAGFAEDANYVYIFNKQVPKSELGDFKLTKGRLGDIFMCSKSAVYANQYKLDGLDSESFELIEICGDFDKCPSTWLVCNAKDKDGDLIIVKYGGSSSPPRVIRGISFDTIFTTVDFSKLEGDANNI